MKDRKEYEKQYREKNRERLNAYKRYYYEVHEDKKKEHYKRVNEYHKKRMQEDPEYRARRNAYCRERRRLIMEGKWPRNTE